jgi:TfoX/Sxy family transcriptional regulator of competence genes
VTPVSYDEALAQRVREVVGELTADAFVERRMFGGLAFLVAGHMAVAASRDGGLLLRIDPGDTDALLAQPGAAPFHMRGGPIDGWLRVDAAAVRSRPRLERWVAHGVRYAQTLPPA